MVEMKHVHEASWSLGAKTLTGHLDLSVKKKTRRCEVAFFMVAEDFSWCAYNIIHHRGLKTTQAMPSQCVIPIPEASEGV